jgi:uncharacterized membrane protein YgaE (UPF0421/DUF939 family)
MLDLRALRAAARWRLSVAGHRALRWLRRAVTTPGPERYACVQAGKAGTAAVVSWLIAADVLGLPQPFLAPYAAIYLVEVTVYRSVRSSVQQIAAVAGGVLLAGVAHALLPVTVGVGVVTALGFLLGRWPRLGPNGTWIAVTALLVLTFGTAGDELLLADRLLETALGAVVGTLVNAVLWPPTFRTRAGRATERAGAELAGLLADMGATLRGAEPPGGAGDWIERAVRSRDTLSEVTELTGLSEENQKLAPRRTTDPRETAEARCRYAVRVLDHAWPHVRHHAAARDPRRPGQHDAAGAPDRARAVPVNSGTAGRRLGGTVRPAVSWSLAHRSDMRQRRSLGEKRAVGNVGRSCSGSDQL